MRWVIAWLAAALMMIIMFVMFAAPMMGKARSEYRFWKAFFMQRGTVVVTERVGDAVVSNDFTIEYRANDDGSVQSRLVSSWQQEKHAREGK